MKLRNYQERLANDAYQTLQQKKIVCLFMEVNYFLYICKSK